MNSALILRPHFCKLIADLWEYWGCTSNINVVSPFQINEFFPNPNSLLKILVWQSRRPSGLCRRERQITMRYWNRNDDLTIFITRSVHLSSRNPATRKAREPAENEFTRGLRQRAAIRRSVRVKHRTSVFAGIIIPRDRTSSKGNIDQLNRQNSWLSHQHYCSLVDRAPLPLRIALPITTGHRIGISTFFLSRHFFLLAHAEKIYVIQLGKFLCHLATFTFLRATWSESAWIWMRPRMYLICKGNFYILRLSSRKWSHNAACI